MTGSEFRIGVDIGGTFTDIVLLAPTGTCVTRKVLSTPDDYSRGILEALNAMLDGNSQAGAPYTAADCREVVHGTTVATNAILEGKGAVTALITTRGFRDVLELRRLRTPTLYNLRFRPPPPMVERRLRLEATERVGPKGEVLEPLDEDSVARAIHRIREEGVEAVAVCLIHSYRNPAHETRVGEIIRRELPSVFLSISAEVLPEIREYERTSTTVINAYVGPIVRSYVASLEQRLQEARIAGPLKIMESGGGTMSARAAAERPAHVVESGPAAGTIAARTTGESLGIEDLIAFDMGGTTAKATLIEDGKVNLTSEYEVGSGISLSSRLIKGGGHALRLPMLDIAEVGAGGGSVVWVDRGGALKVGPQSAGAAPGPACYGLGGECATVTDANLVLGYLNPRELAGGALELHPELAHAALAEVAVPLRTSVERAAHGVYVVANATMIRAIKAVSTYRGRDPRDFSLLAFGGGGPLHAVAIARELGIERVVVPPNPGVFSAFGLLQAPPEAHRVQAFVRATAGLDPAEPAAVYRDLEERTREALIRDGHNTREIRLTRCADLRYVGQAYELTVPAGDGAMDSTTIRQLEERFAAEHERAYGHRAEDEPIEIVNLRVVGTVDAPDGSARAPDSSFSPAAQLVTNSLSPSAGRAERGDPLSGRGRRPAFFGDRWLETPILERADLPAQLVDGPLIVEDYDSTTVVPPGSRARLDASGCIVVEARTP
jgi:N-methylhydantoinase A